MEEAGSPSRFVVGIDLGTTNSALCYVDTESSTGEIQTFRIPQLIAPGEVEARETLPSFLYLAGEQEFPAGALKLPWQKSHPTSCVGWLAREQGKLAPGRSVESAKSWLCHPGVDRTAALLPWPGQPDVQRLSPVQASAAYLTHLREAWDARWPAHPLAEQEVVITLPASFDEVARSLTVQAARLAGLPRIVLIEEPQAAFYCWIDAHRHDWEQRVQPGQNILVCDVGGGTSDFTLIQVRRQPDGLVQFQRVAVGEHLILGGDNMDLAMAKQLEPRLSAASPLGPRQWGSLIRLCRQAKETLLGGSFENQAESEEPLQRFTITVPGSGSKLIGGSLQTELTREEARQLILEGFFPTCRLSDRPAQRRSGFQEFGLPYAPDAAITRYLAAFLNDHLRASTAEAPAASSRPDLVLFNGGVFVSPILRQRVLELLGQWFSTPAEPDWQPQVLVNARHDLAVARGAAYYGLVRRGEGVRIAAGLPRTYYLGIDQQDHTLTAVCLAPAGMEPGEEQVLSEQTFELSVATPVEFSLFHSSVRLTDRAGDRIVVEAEQLTPLPPIRTVLRSRKIKDAATLPVQLHVRLTELGTLELWCREVEGARTWQIEFDVRSATQTDRSGHAGTGEALGVVDRELIEAGTQLLRQVFHRESFPAGKVSPAAQDLVGKLAQALAAAVELEREAWPPALLREWWQELFELESGRQIGPEHEARWLNLLGYCLRPGFGVALDDWRVNETWKRLQGGLKHPAVTCLAEWRILWRRIAGGLQTGQQLALATPLLSNWKEQLRRLQSRQNSPPDSAAKPVKLGLTQADAEAWRMCGALEQLPVQLRIELGELAFGFLDLPEYRPLQNALIWAIGRLGARQPIAGGLQSVIPAERVRDWLPRLMTRKDAVSQLAVMQLARRTDDRYRDLPSNERSQVVRWLASQSGTEDYQRLVEAGGVLAAEAGSLIFGESLPPGLRLRDAHPG